MEYKLKAKCSKCSKAIDLKTKVSASLNVTCSDKECKANNKVRVVMLSDYMKRHKHGN